VTVALAWLGALAGLLALAWRRDGGSAPALEAFSGVGAGIVAALVASGLVNLLADSGLKPVSALTAGPWGWLLAAKLALFAAMLGLAAANRYWLTPRLKAGGGKAIRASLALESALGLAVLILVAVLGRLAPFGDG
jgi:putative copper resistance protein D